MSRPVTVDIPHDLSRAEARARLERGFGRLQGQLGGGMMMAVEQSWQGDTLNFRTGALGQTITGRIDVLDDMVHIEVELPRLLAAIADTLKGRLQKEGRLLLEKK
jgi:putative polyhydroxyalkanoate system protein